jgi:hypothetical protein
VRRLAPVVLAAVAGCAPALPEPDAPGAVVLRERCNGCHRVFAPGTMTREMWAVQLERMHALFAQRGLRWLTPEEERALRAYLDRWAGTS